VLPPGKAVTAAVFRDAIKRHSVYNIVDDIHNRIVYLKIYGLKNCIFLLFVVGYAFYTSFGNSPVASDTFLRQFKCLPHLIRIHLIVLIILGE
jgi:hypothetical protein